MIGPVFPQITPVGQSKRGAHPAHPGDTVVLAKRLRRGIQKLFGRAAIDGKADGKFIGQLARGLKIAGIEKFQISDTLGLLRQNARVCCNPFSRKRAFIGFAETGVGLAVEREAHAGIIGITGPGAGRLRGVEQRRQVRAVKVHVARIDVPVIGNDVLGKGGRTPGQNRNYQCDQNARRHNSLQFNRSEPCHAAAPLGNDS